VFGNRAASEYLDSLKATIMVQPGDMSVALSFALAGRAMTWMRLSPIPICAAASAWPGLSRSSQIVLLPVLCCFRAVTKALKPDHRQKSQVHTLFSLFGWRLAPSKLSLNHVLQGHLWLS